MFLMVEGKSRGVQFGFVPLRDLCATNWFFTPTSGLPGQLQGGALPNGGARRLRPQTFATRRASKTRKREAKGNDKKWVEEKHQHPRNDKEGVS